MEACIVFEVAIVFIGLSYTFFPNRLCIFVEFMYRNPHNINWHYEYESAAFNLNLAWRFQLISQVSLANAA